MTVFKKTYRKSWTLGVGLDAWTLHSWTLDDWTLWLWTTEPLDSWTLGLWNRGLGTLVRLDSGFLDAWALEDWTLGLWSLGARKFFPVLVTSISLLLLVNVEFLIISSAPLLLCYGSVERGVNDRYNSNLLQLIL